MNTEGTRRAVDGTEPEEIIDLTEEAEPVVKRLLGEKMDLYICPVCLEPPEEPVATMCGHVFCKECLIRSFLPSKLCPKCRQRVRSFVCLSLT